VHFNKKLVVVTVMNFPFEVGHEVRVYLSSVASFHIFRWEIACCANSLFEGKNTGQVCLLGTNDFSKRRNGQSSERGGWKLRLRTPLAYVEDHEQKLLLSFA